MKNPFKKKRVHQLNAELNEMLTVTTITFFGFVIYKASKKQDITVNTY